MRTKSIQKQTILEAACSVVKKDGTSKATTRYIAKRGGFSTYPIYANFDSTEKLLDSVSKQLVKELIAELNNRFSEPTIEDIGNLFADYGRENPGIVKSFIFDHAFAMNMSDKLTNAFKKQSIHFSQDEFYVLMVIAYTFSFSNITSGKIITSINKMFNDFTSVGTRYEE